MISQVGLSEKMFFVSRKSCFNQCAVDFKVADPVFKIRLDPDQAQVCTSRT